MQSYFNWKVTGVAITCSDKRHHIPVHILDEGNVLSWDFEVKREKKTNKWFNYLQMKKLPTVFGVRWIQDSQSAACDSLQLVRQKVGSIV
jgi:hypothetical protein